MTYQSVFQRYEIKYILTREQYADIKDAISGKMQIDAYGLTTIRNIYLDTEDYRLIRTSLDHPVYKEKIRIRSYRHVGQNDNVFVELKKKYEGIVYKRRIESENYLAMDWLCAGGDAPDESQIGKEITYFRDFYQTIAPKALITYEREAYAPVDPERDDLRITFDRNILGRDYDISLSGGIYGNKILPEGQVLMEIKVPGVFPLWLTRYLSEHNIRKSSFSKYGEYYTNYILNNEYDKNTKGGLLYA